MQELRCRWSVRNKGHRKTWNFSRKELRGAFGSGGSDDFAMTMYLYDDKVALIGTQKENFGLIILTRLFVMQSHLFETLWQVTRVARQSTDDLSVSNLTKSAFRD